MKGIFLDFSLLTFFLSMKKKVRIKKPTMKKYTFTLSICLLASILAGCGGNKTPRWVDDPYQQKEYFLKDTVFSAPVEPEVGAANLAALQANYHSQADFAKRRAEIRQEMIYQIGLVPMPEQSLNPVFNGKQTLDGYTVENVALEILPGVWSYGNLYRPTNYSGKRPAVMLAQGHSAQDIGLRCGRFMNATQTIAASLAKMGAVVFNFDMFAYGESGEQVGKAAHRTGLGQTMNVLACLSILDWLETLPDVDASKIGMTGASGGGTQTFYTTAIDDRIAVSVPVVQVSCFFPGGCPCESGRPVHGSVEPRTNNAEIAAMAVPRPLLVVSDGGDWTRTVDKVEYPFIQSIYSLYGKTDLAKNVHLPDEGHDYGPSKRYAMYDFMAQHLGLNKRAIMGTDGAYDESFVEILDPETLLVFNRNYPSHSLTSPEQVYDKLREMQQ